ncbi:unnamed protein product, partial [Staurois parvus]
IICYIFFTYKSYALLDHLLSVLLCIPTIDTNDGALFLSLAPMMEHYSFH